jgi:hypothetical protein
MPAARRATHSALGVVCKLAGVLQALQNRQQGVAAVRVCTCSSRYLDLAVLSAICFNTCVRSPEKEWGRRPCSGPTLARTHSTQEFVNVSVTWGTCDTAWNAWLTTCIIEEGILKLLLLLLLRRDLH